MANLNNLTDVGSKTDPSRSQHPADRLTEQDRYFYLWTKRLIDIALSTMLLILLSPLLVIIGLLIKWDSPGPAIFIQERMGYDWRHRKLKTFRFWKFRSMYHNADQSVHQKHIHNWIQGQTGANHSKNGAHLVKLANDERVTRVGQILRRTSLDELPQLWNVLKGEMSLVGPRPVPLYEIAEYKPWHKARLKATPGITGLWQVRGRGQVSVDEMARLDIEYINNQSLGLDFKILILTIPAVILGHGAR